MELQLVTGQVNAQNNYADEVYKKNNISDTVKLIMIKTCQQLQDQQDKDVKEKKPISFPGIPNLNAIYYFEKKLPMSMLEAKMPLLVKTLNPIYKELWRGLTPRQKFILFDFAQDGFANYKAGKDLQALMEKGLLFFDDLRLCVMTLSFQEYVLQQKDDWDLLTFLASTSKENTWKKLKTPLLILLTAVGIFIFVTQDAIYQKITGLLATLTSLLPLLSNMFNRPAGKPGDI